MKQIFEPVKMKNLNCKNRLIRSATWEGLADENGGINDQTYAIYDQLAKGGIGAIITGFTSVSLHDYYFGGMMRFCDDSLIDQYKYLTDLIHKENGNYFITCLFDSIRTESCIDTEFSLSGL